MSASIANKNACSTTLTLPVVPYGSPPESVTVQLTVNDGHGGSDSIEKTIVVQPEPNQPPVAIFNIPATVSSGGTVNLVSESTDYENQTLTCSWEII